MQRPERGAPQPVPRAYAMKKTPLSAMVLLVACLLVVEVRPALAADYSADGPGGDGLAEGGSDANPGTKPVLWQGGRGFWLRRRLS